MNIDIVDVPSYKYDFLVFIGRFQPFHNGHKKVIETALKLSRRVIILIGSANRPRSFRNPFTYDERAEMITKTFGEDASKRISINKLYDHPYNDTAWIKNVQKSVDDVIWNYSFGRPADQSDMRIGLIGHSKDATSYYLNLFPQWGAENVPQQVIYNATDIRKKYFTRTPVISRDILPESTVAFMADFLENDNFRHLVAECEYIKAYKRSWEAAPYPPTFLTADAIVTQSGNILVIERKASPGKGLFAMPGGFLDPGETLLQGAIRELTEETNLKVPAAVLIGSIKKSKVFDDPNRSDRGRVVTQAFHFDLKPQKELPKIKGGSDAGRAFWMPISMIKSEEFFEDHFSIIEDMLGLELND